MVTEAEPARTFEFVTEARLTTKKGAKIDWTLIHRYQITPDDRGCMVRYTVRTTRISALRGPMHLFNVPILRHAFTWMAGAGPRRGVANLVRMADGAMIRGADGSSTGTV